MSDVRTTPAELARWIRGWLSRDGAEEDWRRVLESSWAHLLSCPLGQLVDPAVIDALLARELEPARLEGRARAFLAGELRAGLERAAADPTRPRELLSPELAAAITDLAGEPGWIDERWVHAVFRERAVEAVVTDTLYNALKDFSALLPRLLASVGPLGRLAKLGGGGLGGRVLDELERVLEPEIRRFLEKGSQRAIASAERFTVEHLDDPHARALRKNLVGFALDRSIAEHTGPAARKLVAVEGLVGRLAADLAAEKPLGLRLRTELRARLTAQGSRPLSEVLGALGLAAPPAFDAWAHASWPILQQLLNAPEVERLLERFAADLLAELARVSP